MASLLAAHVCVLPPPPPTSPIHIQRDRSEYDVNIPSSPTLLVEGVEIVGKGACSLLATLTELTTWFMMFSEKSIATPLVKISSAFMAPEV
jgi:hypothetical protein